MLLADQFYTLAINIVSSASDPAYVDDLRGWCERDGITSAVAAHDTPALFNWLARAVSYQGISDAAANAFMQVHGDAEWSQIEAGLQAAPSCPKLMSHWTFHGCGYMRSGSCSEPLHYPACPLPSLPLRNGRLNQTAFSLFLLIREVCDGDLVGWIDQRLASVPLEPAHDYPERLGATLIDPMRQVHGLSDKLLAMTLSMLLMGASRDRLLWFLAGSHMVAIDTLIHNLLHRSGALREAGAEHAYGAICHGPRGCAAIVRDLARSFDARTVNPTFPALFPRYVQHALWRYCAQLGLDICNGNRIDDAKGCENSRCCVYQRCPKLPLRSVRSRRAV